MPRRLWLSLGALILGAGLLASAQLAGAARSTGARQGGIFRVGSSSASVQIDPQLAYSSTTWWLENATAATLYTWSQRRALVPEVASRVVVSNRGRMYRFTLRPGFRFSDGAPVTARSFAYAIRRLQNDDLESPGEYLADGIERVAASGRTLVIRLARPDARFLSELALPVFQATSSKVPLGREGTGPYPSAGRYAFTRNDINASSSLRRNPYWTHGAAGHLDGVDVYWGRDQNALIADVEAGRLDLDAEIPAAARQALADRYGVQGGRFRVRPTSCNSVIPFNTRSRLLRGNVALRKAINYAVDRTDFLAQAGPYSGTPWSHLLPPTVPGSAAAQPYPAHANLAKAARLASGHLRGGRITVYYRSSGTIGPARGELVRRTLVGLGFEHVTMKGFTGGDIYTAFGARSNDADLGVSMAWCGAISSGFGFAPSDPAYYLGPYVQPGGATSYGRRYQAALQLRGAARERAFSKLDLDLTRNVAPAAVMGVYDAVALFSDRVDLRSLAYQPSVGSWSLASLALK
jgi:peptide/nickel transport system substrate-binding protein